MPKKIRELKSMLKKAGFTYRPAKGSHTIWEHPQITDKITLCGSDGDDSPRYLEKRVLQDLKRLKENEQ
jgi:predicted RNA binding protein YcfA (HicA-like mRNA interferase family)